MPPIIPETQSGKGERWIDLLLQTNQATVEHAVVKAAAQKLAHFRVSARGNWPGLFIFLADVQKCLAKSGFRVGADFCPPLGIDCIGISAGFGAFNARYPPESADDFLLQGNDIDVANRHNGHQIGAVPFLVKLLQRSYRGMFDDGRIANRQALQASGAPVQQG